MSRCRVIRGFTVSERIIGEYQTVFCLHHKHNCDKGRLGGKEGDDRIMVNKEIVVNVGEELSRPISLL